LASYCVSNEEGVRREGECVPVSQICSFTDMPSTSSVRIF
jgi:hypothetical protein